ncbi:MAG: 50S ribosomal protein L18 [Candidatus Riflebacteria bacterium]|nr:50S ribosomal protein L18 [Candidatus Riflebacteria bacterium]
MSTYNKKHEMRIRRHTRSRFYFSGTSQKPRLSVFRSIKHIYCQIIDDEKGATLACASSNEPAMREGKVNGGNKDGAKRIGSLIAQRALEKGISTVVFDKGGFQYHGRIKELADAARQGGLKF